MSRIIVVTGVTRGLGRSLVDRFVEAGHTLIGCGRNADHIARLSGEHGPPHRFDPVDVADAEAVRRWAGSAIESVGIPDLVVNNAALINEPAPVWEVPDEDWSAIVDVNIKGVAYVASAFVPAMIRAGRGVVVNLSSGWGRSTSPDVGPYCTTKWAVEGFSRALADDLPAGLSSVAWSPGVVHTDMLRTCFGPSAANHSSPEEWSHGAAQALLELGPGDNGRSL